MPDKKITSLTPRQEAALGRIRDEWLTHGLSTEPANRPEAEAGIRAAYQAGGLEPPRFVIWLGSPWAGVIGQAVAPGIIADILHGPVAVQVDDRVAVRVRGRVGAQVGARVDDRVDGRVRVRVRGQVDRQVGGQVDDRVDGRVRGPVHGQVDRQVGVQVDDRVAVRVRGRVRVGGQVDVQVGAQVDDRVAVRVRGQVDRQVGVQVAGPVDRQVGGQVISPVGGPVAAPVPGRVDVQVDGRLLRWWEPVMYGQHNAGYYSYYAAMEAIGVTGLAPIHGQQQVARNAGWWWPFAGFCIVTDRPGLLRRDAAGQLHSASGMAIRYRDGWGFHAWHGRRVPAWVIDDPAPERIAAETNVEIRRCGIEALGWDRFTAAAGLVPAAPRVPDPGNPGQHLVLYDVPERLWGSRIRLLLATNGSAERDGTRRRYGLTVPADISDPLEAAAWTAGLSRDEYARMVRRT